MLRLDNPVPAGLLDADAEAAWYLVEFQGII